MTTRVIGLYIYDRMADWEAAIVFSQVPGDYAGFRTALVPFSEGGKTVTALSGMRYAAQAGVEQMALDGSLAGIIIPGGYDRACSPQLAALLARVHREGKLVAAICGAPEFLARAGVLRDVPFTTSLSADAFSGAADPFDWSLKRNDPVVVSGGVITARPDGFIAFGTACAGYLGRYASDADRHSAEAWLRGV